MSDNEATQEVRRLRRTIDSWQDREQVWNEKERGLHEDLTATRAQLARIRELILLTSTNEYTDRALLHEILDVVDGGEDV